MLKYKIITHKNGEKHLETGFDGKALLSIPRLNKGTAFSKEERSELGLKGKLPNRIETLEEQTIRSYSQFKNFNKLKNRNAYLNRLLNNNQTLFFNLVKEHIAEMLPTIYTPMVGDFVQTYNRRFMNPRGLYISYEDQDDIEEILDNRSNKEIKIIVVSDGEAVLGIGDQGVGAMAIPIAKLMVYSVFGGVNPDYTLPIMLDTGTNNEELLNDPFYLGWRHPRIEGKKYNAFMDKFIIAIKKKFPHVFLHWEDFGRINAYRNLIAYRETTCTFNDDIQGTGVVALAAAMSTANKTGTRLQDQRFVIFGGGAAGMGVTESICRGLVDAGLTEKEARAHFWILDRPGLLTEHCDAITPAQQDYIRSKDELKDWTVDNKNNITLIEVIRHVKPTILIGSSAQTGAFTKDIVCELAKHIEHPTILPLSNPNERAEAKPADIIEWTQGKAFVATGSPFDHVSFEGKIHTISQCNNYLAFPGIGLGIIAVQAKRVTETMLLAASKALGNYAYQHCESLLPVIAQVEAASKGVAIAVARAAVEEGIATNVCHDKPIEQVIEETLWSPHYIPYKKMD